MHAPFLRARLAPLALSLSFALAGPSQAAAWPDRPITLVVPFGAGGITELAGEPESMVFALPKELRLRLVD